MAEHGTPQRAVISPLLANDYLHPVDVAISGASIEVIHYADDLVLMCESREDAQRALTFLEDIMSTLSSWSVAPRRRSR